MAFPPERDIGLLKKQNEAALNLLFDSLGDLLKKEPGYDQLWVLRFLMSAKGNVAKAEANIRWTVNWRQEKRNWVQVCWCVDWRL